MITVTSEPPSITRANIGGSFEKQPPVPMSDCVRWCLQADAADAVSTPGSQATVVITIPGTCTVPSNGTPLKIWGYDFEVDDSVDFTSTSFKVVTSGLLTTLNFANMIFAHYFFNRATTATFAIIGGDFEVTIIWNECREQPRFVVEQMVFTAINDLGGSGAFTNGVSPVYVEGYKILVQVGFFQDATSAWNPVPPSIIGLDVDKQCTEVGEVCVDFKHDIEQGLFTHFPELTSTSFISSIENGRSLMRLFALMYGWTYRENCQALSGTLKLSDIVLGINAAFDVDDAYQMRRYWPNHPEGYPTGQSLPEYLTTQPKSIELCIDSFAWLWLLSNWQLEYGVHSLSAHFVLYKKGVSGPFEFFDFVINDALTMGSSFYQPVNFNVSPAFVLANAPTLTAATLDYYEVAVQGVDEVTLAFLFNASEYLKFHVTHCCEGTTDLYFLTPPGGWATQVITIQETQTVRDGQEVNIFVSCATDRITRAGQGGRTLVSLRSYQRIEFSISCPNDDEWSRWMKHLIQSPQHKIKVPSERVFSVYPVVEEAPIAKKFLLDLNSITTSLKGQGIEIRATGYVADIPTQIGTEPPLS